MSREPHPRVLLAVLLVAVCLAYLPALRGGFVWDDGSYVAGNDSIRSLTPSTLVVIATTPQVGNYHPLTMLSLAIDRALFGLDPFGYHLVNLLLHLANVLLVRRLARDLSRRDDVAVLAAALWGLHPLRVESVAWISGRKDLLYTAFFLLALLAYRAYARTGAARAYAGSLCGYVLSLLSKGMAVSLALVLPASDFLDRRALTRRSLLDKLPYFALSLVFGLVAIEVQRGWGALETDSGRPLLDRAIVAGHALVTYLAETVWPARLSPYVPYPTPPGRPLPTSLAITALGLVPLVFLVAWSLRRTRKVAFAAAFWIATTALVLQVVPVGGAMLADRYTYVPGIALAWIAAEGVVTLASRGDLGRKVAWTGAGIALAVLPVLTFRQSAVWHDDITLWRDVTRKVPGSPEAWRNLGLRESGVGRKREAIACFDAAIRLRPDYVLAYNGRANALADLGEREAAARDYEQIVRLAPDSVLGYYGLAYLAGETGDFQKAARGFTRVLEIDPRMLEARLNRGEAYLRIGRFEEALRDFDAALALAPDSPVARDGREQARRALGR